MFVGESLKWCERNLTLDEFKNNSFLAQDRDGRNTFVISAKNLLRQDFMSNWNIISEKPICVPCKFNNWLLIYML